ncbi:GerMN domain-containing protein [Vermiculatibacterium agrestimuris]|jgi:hypothetical protein|uniref:GerMN domain-containing protein n=1 Tax=Vermiculatibacterium agrestimuris TaxID=2941519 RepID=UPI00203E0B97|nr:GerMN domain-containing protein [Vermiculatibacterium agrestimuris]
MKKRLAAALLALSLLCAACSHRPGRDEEPPEGQYAFYFITASGRRDDAALDREFREPSSGGTVEGLMTLLLSGPESDSLASPFPSGTALRGWSISDGVAAVDLSEAYEGLSGAELTLADGCIVLTLCQLEGVEAVYLTVEGHPRPFRDQVLEPSDFLLRNTLQGEEEIT